MHMRNEARASRERLFKTYLLSYSKFALNENRILRKITPAFTQSNRAIHHVIRFLFRREIANDDSRATTASFSLFRCYTINIRRDN